MNIARRNLPLVVVSAVAALKAGPLTMLNQAVSAARGFRGADFLFLVHDHRQWQPDGNVRFLGFPRAAGSYVQRILAEYAMFPALSRRWRPDVWLSLLDTSPPVRARRQAVYCHNPLPCWSPTVRDFRLSPKEVLRSFVFGLVVRAFVARNDFLVGQLPWYTEFMGTYVGLHRDRWLVVAPSTETGGRARPRGDSAPAPLGGRSLECVYVSLPRVFKNFEEAIDLCRQEGVRLTLTLSGTENRYARYVRAYSGDGGDVRFIGQVSHAESLATLAHADVVLFPSRLETFGLPIQEAIDLERTLLLPVRPWTAAIAADYPRAHFYRSVSEGCQILAALARGERPTPWRPSPAASDLPRLSGFGDLYGLLLS